jgi:hypothetical protein
MSITSGSGGPFVAPPGPPPTGSGMAQSQTAPSYTLVNSTATILTVQVPADGRAHTCVVASNKRVTSNETGGAITLNWTCNGQAQNTALHAGGQASGNFPVSQVICCDAGTLVTITQSSALTAGASVDSIDATVLP